MRVNHRDEPTPMPDDSAPIPSDPFVLGEALDVRFSPGGMSGSEAGPASGFEELSSPGTACSLMDDSCPKPGNAPLMPDIPRPA